MHMHIAKIPFINTKKKEKIFAMCITKDIQPEYIMSPYKSLRKGQRFNGEISKTYKQEIYKRLNINEK